MRLKNLIVLGKERGYLTYAEVNDHLPDDMLDAEQIENIISMINDMGIQVYDEAPDAETLLMSDATPPVADEDVVEQAEAALLHRRFRIRPHHRPGAHVHARDGLGRTPDARRRNRNRQAHRRRPQAHDPGDLGVPDHHRRNPRARRPHRKRRNPRRRSGRRAGRSDRRRTRRRKLPRKRKRKPKRKKSKTRR